MADDPQATGNDALLKEIREFRDYSWARWQKNRDQGDLDMKALSVEGPWPKEELEARKSKDNPRPHGHTDIISPFNNRVVNQARMNPRGVEVIPRGDGADEKTAEDRENRLRGIDYESHGSQARLTGLQNAVDRGVGYWRVDTEYESPRSRNLKIVIKRIPNVNAILDDPDCQEADRSDRKRFIICQWIHIDEAKRRWKGLKDPESFSQDIINSAGAWIRPKQMLFAEFWKVHETFETLYYFGGNPEGVFESELPEGAAIQDGAIVIDGQSVEIEGQREGVQRRVVRYFTNGLQIFEQKEWPGTTIPFPTCVGREKYEGDDLVIESMTRKLRQPQLSFDVVRAAEEESIAMTPKSKWQISDKAIEGYEDMWKMVHRNPMAYVKWHERDEEGRENTKPERIDFSPATDALEIAANSYIRDAQNAADMTGVDQKERQTQSGVAQDKIDQAADIASFHFIDSWLMAIEFEGRICNELLDKIEDSQRSVGFRSKDGKYSVKKIRPMEMPDGSIQHPYGPAEAHSVTIATGPNYQSQQDKADKYLTDLIKESDFVTNPLAPLIIEAMRLGPTGDTMQKVAIAVQQNPAVRAIYQGDKGPPPIPPELLAEKQQLEAALADAMTQLDEVKAKKAEIESKERMNTENNETKIAVAEIGAKQKMLAEDLSAFMLKMDRVFDLLMQEREHEHAVNMPAVNAAAQPEPEAGV